MLHRVLVSCPFPVVCFTRWRRYRFVSPRSDAEMLALRQGASAQPVSFRQSRSHTFLPSSSRVAFSSSVNIQVSR